MKILKDRSSHLEDEMVINQNKAASKNNMILSLTLLGIIGMIFGVWVWVMSYNFTYSMIIMFLSAVSMQFAWETHKESQRDINAYRKGISGEESVISTLNYLDDTYYLINDIVLERPYGNIDHILLGPNGIFVIETKNYKGTIRCDRDEWSRIYPSKYGFKTYQMTSPSKQAKGNAMALGKFLKENTNIIIKVPDLFISSIVVFAEQNTHLKLDNPTLPVLKIDELNDYILNNKSNIQFTDDDLGSIAKSILNASKTGNPVKEEPKLDCFGGGNFVEPASEGNLGRDQKLKKQDPTVLFANGKVGPQTRAAKAKKDSKK